MIFESAKCPFCSHTIVVDDSLQQAHCPYCVGFFSVQEAIKLGKLALLGVRSYDQLLARFESQLKASSYSKAAKTAETLIDIDSSDYRGWWGLILARTHDFTNFAQFQACEQEIGKLKSFPTGSVPELPTKVQFYDRYMEQYRQQVKISGGQPPNPSGGLPPTDPDPSSRTLEIAVYALVMVAMALLGGLAATAADNSASDGLGLSIGMIVGLSYVGVTLRHARASKSPALLYVGGGCICFLVARFFVYLLAIAVMIGVMALLSGSSHQD